ncbi:MAG: hypothetical protein K8S27_09630 [Candidatus Omnitrophica bacterium]|nr:hypothetical protein [Candidatus Omnitrophota bacterium]
MMKKIIVLVLLLALTGLGHTVCAGELQFTEADSPGVGLRRLLLTTPPGELEFSSDENFSQVYGVLTDWDIGGVKATVMSLRDGTASLYTTSTFGIIGGQGYKRVRKTALRYVFLAGQFVESSRPVNNFAYPESGQVYFYLLTYDGVRLCVGDEAAIKRGTDPLRDLFAAAQNVLTELRGVTEQANPSE